MRIAVITGASSGLGKTYALEIDKTELNLDEIWLIARREERLHEIGRKLRHAYRAIPADLTNEKQMESIRQMLSVENPEVVLFINCAGYAKIGNYEKVSFFDTGNMIDLNCKAAVLTTLAVLPYMQSGARIMEICSTAAFQPIQHLNLYAASKAFLYSYTRALRMELLPRGIVVTAVCPWWIKDTEFISTASNNEANQDVTRAIRHFPLATKEVRVVRTSLRDNRIGFAVSTPGVMCFFHRLFSKVLPKKWLLYFWEIFRRI